MPVTSDFPTWFRAGCYGGLACSLLAAAGVAGYALTRRRGTPRQLAGAMLGCLAAAVSILPAIIWSQTRLDLQGPALSASEVLLWLAWVAVIGWMLPLGSSAGFLLYAAPFDARQAFKGLGRSAWPSPVARVSSQERQQEPLGKGIAWGRLVHLDGPYLHREIALTQQVVLLGRERDNDILLDADLASRYHAELRWERGRGYLMDAGSMNGTSVNGQKIWGLAPLHAGDVLEIGGHRFRYEDGQSQIKSPKGSPGSKHANIQTQMIETTPLPALVVPASRLPPLQGQLMVNGGPDAGSRYPLSGAVLTIGRSGECDVIIEDSSISRRHAQIVRQEDGFYAQDLGSRNGSALNGQRLIAPRRLADGDTLTLGAIPLRYRSAVPPEERERPETAALPPAPPAEGTPAWSAENPLPTRAPGSRAPTAPLRGRESYSPLRLPTRGLGQPPSVGQEAEQPAPTPAPPELSPGALPTRPATPPPAATPPPHLPPTRRS